MAKNVKEVRGIYCNPIEWLDECAIGLRKWAKELKKTDTNDLY